MAAVSIPIDAVRDPRRRWARPQSGQDRAVKVAMVVLPSAIGALAAVLIIAPLLARSEISFVLAKDKVALASERMRASEAKYRGTDDQGRPFALSAGSAVQKTSRVAIVDLSDLTARMKLDDGPAVLRAPEATYDLEKQNVRVTGPLTFASAKGYRLQTRNVGVDFRSRVMASDAPVTGQMPLGTFSGDRLRADLNARTVVLQGRARLHIVQGAVKAR